MVLDENPCIIKAANSWIIMNLGGRPTDDKPEVTLQPPTDLNTASSFLNIRVANIDAFYVSAASKAPNSSPTDRPASRAPLLHARP